MKMPDTKKVRPKILDVIPEYLDNEDKINATEFVEYMRSNKMTLSHSGIINTWHAKCKGKRICTVKLSLSTADFEINEWKFMHPELPELNKSSWQISLSLIYLNGYADIIDKEEMENLILSNIRLCFCYPNKCGNALNITVLNKEVKNVCHQPSSYHNSVSVKIWNPDKKTISKIKRLIELEKNARTEKI
jgi:hypothetical protein